MKQVAPVARALPAEWVAAIDSAILFASDGRPRIAGFSTMTDAERVAALKANDGAPSPWTPLDAPPWFANMLQSGEVEWLALVKRYGWERIGPLYVEFMGATSAKKDQAAHNAAMRLIEAVEQTARKRGARTIGWAAEYALHHFLSYVPEEETRLRRGPRRGSILRKVLADLAIACGAWSGKSGNRARGPRQYDLLVNIARTLVGYSTTPEDMRKRYSEWKRKLASRR